MTRSNLRRRLALEWWWQLGLTLAPLFVLNLLFGADQHVGVLTMPLFIAEKPFRTLINQLKTNSLEPGEPKDPDTCTLFSIYKALS